MLNYAALLLNQTCPQQRKWTPRLSRHKKYGPGDSGPLQANPSLSLIDTFWVDWVDSLVYESESLHFSSLPGRPCRGRNNDNKNQLI